MKKVLFLIVSLYFCINPIFALNEIVQTYSEDNKFGLISNNQKITKPIYKKLIRLGKNSWIFMQGTKYGIISNDGEILVDSKFNSAYRFSGGRFVRFGSGNKYILFNESAQALTTLEMQSIEILYGKMFLIKKDYKYGLISYDGDYILAPIADEIYMPKPNILKIKYDGIWYEIEQKNKETIQLPSDLANIPSTDKDFKVTTLVQKPIASTGYGIISASNYFIKIFSSISPSYEQTIDELIFYNGADSISSLVKFSWLFKFPYIYTKNYINNLKAPNNGPLSEVKSNLKNKINN